MFHNPEFGGLKIFFNCFHDALKKIVYNPEDAKLFLNKVPEVYNKSSLKEELPRFVKISHHLKNDNFF
jgi:hypothetical protein